MDSTRLAAKVFIYALVDPRDELVRYVGQSMDPERRLRDHLVGARSGQGGDRANWILDLIAEGVEPTMVVLEECEEATWEEAERRWISHYLALDAGLLNLTRGGKGVHGWWTDERLWMTEEKVMSIRQEYAAGDSTYYLARKYGTSHTNIRWIVTGRTWKHLPLVSTENRVAVDRHKRGNENTSRLHPERKPHGDAHWTRIDPSNLVTLRGEDCPWATVTEEQVREIRALYAQGVFQRDIGARFGLSQTQVGRIVRRERWKHVT